MNEMIKQAKQSTVKAHMDHWHLSLHGGPEECVPFREASRRAAKLLLEALPGVEQQCVRYPSRTYCRCDVCPACLLYYRVDGALSWIQDLYEDFVGDRTAFEVRRTDFRMDETAPDGARIRVVMRDPKKSCSEYDDLNLTFD